MGTTGGWETRRRNAQARQREWEDALFVVVAEEAAKVCDRLAEGEGRHALPGDARAVRATAFREAATAIRNEVRP